MRNFINFIREQGVVGLAVGFLLGGSIAKVVSALIEDIINPLIGFILGATSGLDEATIVIFGAIFKWGDFVSNLIDFLVISAVVYFGVKMLGIDKLDKKKEIKL